MQFLAKIVNSSRGVFRTSRTSKMKLFEKKIFSRPLFQLFTIYTKSSILDVLPSSEYASGTFNYFRKGFHLDTSLTCLKKDKNCKKPVRELFLETLQLRLRNNFQEISEKNSIEKWFSSHLFSASFIWNPEAAIRGVLKKELFLKIS